MEAFEEEIVSMKDVRAALMVLINAWYRKMKLPNLARTQVKPPVLTVHKVASLLNDMASLSYMRPVIDQKSGKTVYQETEPMDDKSGKLERFNKIHERINDIECLKDIALKLNKAMLTDNTHSNFLEKMHGSLLAAIVNDKNTTNNLTELHETNEPLKQGQTCWFTLDSVVNSLKMRGKSLDELNGHLCTYTLYHNNDVKGGRTGKVIVCAQSAVGIDHIPERVAKMINESLRKYYHADGDYAMPVDLDQVQYNLDGGVDVNTGIRKLIRRTGIKGTGMKKGVVIADTPLVKDRGSDTLIEPRKAVSDMFMRGELDITRFSALVNKAISQQVKPLEDKDDENSSENKQTADITKGHEELQNMGSDEARQHLFNTLKAHMGNIPSYIKLLNAVASSMTVDQDSLDTAWKVVDGYENPAMTDDDYVNLANTVSSVSKYIIESTKGAFSKEHAPFAVEKLFDNENVVFASNVYPSKSGSTLEHAISLDEYLSVMSQIFNITLSDNTDNALQRLLKSAKNACSNIASFVTGVYALLEPALQDYGNVDSSTLSARKESNALAKQFSATEIDVAKMDKYIGFDSIKTIQDLTGKTVNSILPLSQYLNNVDMCINELAQSSDSNVDLALEKYTPEKLLDVNDALNTLINGNSKKGMSLDKAKQLLVNMLRTVTVTTAEPKAHTQAQQTTPVQPENTNETEQAPTKANPVTTEPSTDKTQQPDAPKTDEPPNQTVSSTMTPSDDIKPARRRSGRFNMDKV